MFKLIVTMAFMATTAGCASAMKPKLYAPLGIEFCAKKENADRAFCKKPFLGDERTLPNSKVGNICISTDDFVALVKFFRKYCTENPSACSWKHQSKHMFEVLGGGCSGK